MVYLEQIGVDPATQLELVIASHWHDDHVQGLAEVLDAAPAATFVCPSAFTKHAFLTLVKTFGTNPLAEPSGIHEMRRAFESLATIARPRKWVGELQTVLRREAATPPIDVTALSPSHAAFERSLLSFEALLGKKFEPIGSVPDVLPNEAALVIEATVGHARVVLGSDLEEFGDTTRGWSRLVSDEVLAQRTSSLFKVPHHGSNTAFHLPFWQTNAVQNCVAVLTPWRTPLPTVEGLEWLRARTPNGFITTPRATGRAPRRAGMVEAEISKYTKDGTRTAVPRHPGWIRCRVDASAPNSEWDVELFGAACSWQEVAA